MRKEVKILTLLVFLLLLPAAIAYTSTNTNNTIIPYADSGYFITATLLNQDPDPAEPGGYVELRFKIENEGVDGTLPLTFELIPGYPFSFDKSSDAIKEIGSMRARQMGEEALVLYYKLRVNEDAVEGVNPVELRFKQEGEPGWLYFDEFDVRIQTIDAAVNVISVNSTPEQIPPGGKAEVVITVKNLADSLMKDVSLKLDLGMFTSAAAFTATTAAEAESFQEKIMPLAPLNSGTEKRVKYIKPGEEYGFVYQVIAFPNAESKVYKVPIELKYFDELEKEYTKNDIVSLVIGAEPELGVEVLSYDIIKGSTGNVLLKFINKGFVDIKRLDVQLKESGNYEIISSESYIGDVDYDDYETAEFKLYVKKLEDKKLALPFHIEYRDANNNEYSKDIIVNFRVFSAKEKGEADGGILSKIITLLVIAGIGFFIYKRWKKKKKPKSSEAQLGPISAKQKFGEKEKKAKK